MTETIKVKIEGLNFAKIVNALVKEGVLIKNLKQKTKSVVFDLEKKQENKLKEICKRYHKKYHILSENGLINILKRTRYYFGFMVAFILSVIFMFVFNMYIYNVNIKVDNNSSFDLQSIKKLLDEENIVRGMKKSDVEILKLQNMIIASRNDISGCSVKLDGGNLDILIYPSVLKDNLSSENIYSKYNAVITDIEIFAGSSTLKVGDIVTKGDLLIENKNGAAGNIHGKVYYCDYLIYNENQIIKEKTGRFDESVDVCLFNKNLIKSNNNINFSNYFEEKCVFSVSKNTFIPVSLVKTKYLEFVYKEQVVKFESKEDELKEQLYLKVLEQIEDQSAITGVTYSVVTENNLTRLDCFVECEIDLTI